MARFYLLNQDVCKGTKAQDEEDDDPGAMGLLNLYTMASMCLPIYQYKECRGLHCKGPCPRHCVFDYCAADAWVSLASWIAMEPLLRQMGIPEQTERELHELLDLCLKMEQQGIHVDKDFVRVLERSFEEQKELLFPKKKVTGLNGETIPTLDFEDFNPRSPDQIMAYFTSVGVLLSSSEKKEVKKALERRMRRFGYVKIEDLEGEGSEVDEVLDRLYRLYQYKETGKGLKSWFKDDYIHKDGCLHPRFNPCGSSMNRLASSHPNFTNVPRIGFGRQVRKAIIAPPGYVICKADSSQLELRMCLYWAGVDPSTAGKDAFTWLVESDPSAFQKAVEQIGMKSKNPRRDLAKSLSHAGDYLEGLRILYPEDLIRTNIKRDIEYGALRVYMKKYMPSLDKDWEYRGGIVAFTGVNLADRFFGSHTLENRKRALELQEDLYFARFSVIRKWQRKVLAEVEARRFVQSTTGRFLRLYGDPEEDAKMATASYGQGGGAEYEQGVMLQFGRRGDIPRFQVHDELGFYLPEDWSDAKVLEFFRPMTEEVPGRLPGFKCPAKVARGKNWLETKEVTCVGAT